MWDKLVSHEVYIATQKLTHIKDCHWELKEFLKLLRMRVRRLGIEELVNEGLNGTAPIPDVDAKNPSTEHQRLLPYHEFPWYDVPNGYCKLPET